MSRSAHRSVAYCDMAGDMSPLSGWWIRRTFAPRRDLQTRVRGMADQRTDFPRRPTGKPVVDSTTVDLPRLHTPRVATWVRYRQQTLRLQSENGEVASWLIFMAGLVAAALAAVLVLSFVIAQLTNNVSDAAEGADSPPRGTAPEPGTGDPDGSGANTGPPPGTDPLPVRTRHCSLTVNASGDALGLGVGLETGVDVIIQELPDGTQIVTIAGDISANGGTGPAPWGAGITINDSTIGAYASASADAHGGVGGGVQYELAPGETVAELFVGLAVSSNPVTGPISGGINTVFPDTIPTAPPPDTIFVDGDAWVTAGGTAQAGVGFISAGANGTAQAGVNQTYAAHGDGTYSATTTYSGELSADGGATGGVPFFAWGAASVAGEAQGSIAVQTIYDSSFNPVEMVVTTSYGYDGDAFVGSDSDNPTITTQQWTLDLTDPDVAAAVENLDAFVPNSPIVDIPTGNPFDSWDVISDNAVTSGALEQVLSTSQVDVQVEAGAIVAGVSGGVNGTCTDLQ